MKTHIVENTWLGFGGWGNGYVLIPPGHPFHGRHYNDIEVDVHGGLTFSQLVDDEMAKRCGLSQEDIGTWCIGFDTAHYGDTKENCTQVYVQSEADRLLEQIMSIYN